MSGAYKAALTREHDPIAIRQGNDLDPIPEFPELLHPFAGLSQARDSHRLAFRRVFFFGARLVAFFGASRFQVQ
jgi:hypothetical protein